MVRKDNYFDRLKKTKFSPQTSDESHEQLMYLNKWCEDMKFRKVKGDEKYGNYMMDIDSETSFRELEEEMLDVCNHLIMLTFKLRKQFVKEKSPQRTLEGYDEKRKD